MAVRGTSIYSKRWFLVSPPAMLKLTEILLLLLSLSLYVVSGECWDDVIHVTLFLLPVTVCCLATLVTYVTALVMMCRHANPVLTAAWVKGDVLFNIAAMTLLTFGAIVTLEDGDCLNDGLTIAAGALCVVVVILYAASGAVIWLLYVRNQEMRTEQQRQQTQADGKRDSATNPGV